MMMACGNSEIAGVDSRLRGNDERNLAPLRSFATPCKWVPAYAGMTVVGCAGMMGVWGSGSCSQLLPRLSPRKRGKRARALHPSFSDEG